MNLLPHPDKDQTPQDTETSDLSDIPFPYKVINTGIVEPNGKEIKALHVAAPTPNDNFTLDTPYWRGMLDNAPRLEKYPIWILDNCGMEWTNSQGEQRETQLREGNTLKLKRIPTGQFTVAHRDIGYGQSAQFGEKGALIIYYPGGQPERTLDTILYAPDEIFEMQLNFLRGQVNAEATVLSEIESYHLPRINEIRSAFSDALLVALSDAKSLDQSQRRFLKNVLLPYMDESGFSKEYKQYASKHYPQQSFRIRYGENFCRVVVFSNRLVHRCDEMNALHNQNQGVIYRGFLHSPDREKLYSIEF